MVEIKYNKRKTIKRQAFIDLASVLLIVLFLNIIFIKFHTRIDLTGEKRYTLADASVKILSDLDDVVFIKVYLDGDLPPGFKRLKNSVKETLENFRSHAGENLGYEFFDPSSTDDQKIKNSIYSQLAEKGIQPTNLHYKTGGGTAQKIIFPGALIYYKGKELPVQFLKSKMGESPESNLNNSIESIEFELMHSIRKLIKSEKIKIAFITGQGELNDTYTQDITLSLQEYYDVERINLTDFLPDKLNKYKAIIIAKPTEKFHEKEKFKIDQYIMQGGNVLWLVEMLNATMDSLKGGNPQITTNYDLNLEDQLFKYGVRVNPDMINDLKCAPIPIVTGFAGDQPQQMLLPWYFFPLLTANNKHPIVKNLESVKSEFANTIDFVGKTKTIKKTILLTSSQYTKILNPPVRIHLDVLRTDPDPKQFIKKNKKVAVLLEGVFSSVFENRLSQSTKTMLDSLKLTFHKTSKPTKMIVVSDGDIIKNDIHLSDMKTLPLGYDKYTNKTFGNKNFILNCIDYLCDDYGIISIRSKDVELRLLDKLKVENERSQWQFINVGLPIILLLLFGVIYNVVKRNKYTSDST